MYNASNQVSWLTSLPMNIYADSFGCFVYPIVAKINSIDKSYLYLSQTVFLSSNKRKKDSS